VRAVSLLTIGGILGFMVVYGPWGWFLWERFGNPFGPLFNDTFRAPLFPIDAQRDLRFLPSGLAHALAYPLLWAHRTQGLVLEPPLADPRFAIALAALVLLVAIGAWRRLHRSRYLRAVRTADTLCDSAHRVAARAERAVLAFVLVSYASWLGLFSILRYAVPIEVLLGIPLWAAARQLLRATPEQGLASPVHSWRAGATLCVATALGISALVTEYPAHPREPFAWDREPHGLAAVAVGHVALPAGSLVVMIGPAVSFVAPLLDGPGVRFVGGPNFEWAGATTDPASYAAQVLRAVQSHPGPIFAVLEFADSYDREAARVLGITVDPASCRAVPNNLTTAVQLCSLAMSHSRSM
jgi:hypothetical protein